MISIHYSKNNNKDDDYYDSDEFDRCHSDDDDGERNATITKMAKKGTTAWERPMMAKKRMPA